MTSKKRTTATRLGLSNSTLLGGDVPATVAELKQASSSNLVIMVADEDISRGHPIKRLV